MESSNKTVNIFGLLIFLLLAFFAGNYSVDRAGIEAKGYGAGYSAGYKTAWDNATAIVDSIQAPIIPLPKGIYSISGKIRGISASDNSLVIEADPVSTNPLSSDSKSTIRTVRIISATKIVKVLAKTPQEIQEMLAQNKTFSPFSEQELTFSQLKAGDRIAVTSDRNIRDETEITAAKIALS